MKVVELLILVSCAVTYATPLTSSVPALSRDAPGAGYTRDFSLINTIALKFAGAAVAAPPAGDDESSGSGSSCFPADAAVELESGTQVPMSSIQVGDRVKTSANRYSVVFMFTHRLHSGMHEFVALRASSSAGPIYLKLSAGHYLPVHGELKPANSVVPGDKVELGDESMATVISVSNEKSHGLFNPQTVDGQIVVNGVVASTYTTAVEPSAAHALLLPIRAMFCASGAGRDPTAGLLEWGAEGLLSLSGGILASA